MWRYVYGFALFTLCACQPESAEKTDAASDTVAQNIASSILNTPQSEDILNANQHALSQISASDIAAAEQLDNQSTPAFQAASSEALNTLPESCRQYYQRAKQCFARQNNADALIQLLNEQQAELAQEAPDENACQALNHSFDGVTNNLQCP